MEKRTKIILLAIGGVLVAGSIGLGIYFLVKKNREESDNGDINPYVGSTQKSNGGSTNTTNSVSTQSQVIETDNSGLVTPTFNSENELSNPLSQLKDRYLYPKRKAQGGWDYANVRSSAEVNND